MNSHFEKGILWENATSTGGGDGLVCPLGTLLRFGYVEEPELLYCPSFVREPRPSVLHPMTYGRYFFDRKMMYNGNKNMWNEWTAGKEEVGPARTLGVSHLLITRDPWKLWDSRENTRIGFVASHWRDNWTTKGMYGTMTLGVSPYLISCANYDYGGIFGMSHRGIGLNAAVFDGSARWISVEEVAVYGWLINVSEHYLSNSAGIMGHHMDNFQHWARAVTEY
ncbi:MAG: hypothetical protein HQL31_04160 [Planctomycetes bacterium]|nr:hypothetical protein [Planctomycetota bacterium]